MVRFWLDIGLDGFRLDAVPYLYERDGTNGENLPETHDFLKQLRREVDTSHPGKVLLAEANQWPSDVLAYFGDGDECHMCFNFPLMPRMYLAAKRGDREPIERILDEMPEIPPGCQWGLFLRNHDELTLEMVTDIERDEMYAEYARDPEDAAQHRHRPAAGAAARQQPAADGAVPRPAAVAAREPGPLLRRRDRDGRQHLPRRPRRGAHADAVDARPQRRVLDVGLRAAVPAADHGPGVRLPGGERGGAAAEPGVVPALGAAHARRPRRATRSWRWGRTSRWR